MEKVLFSGILKKYLPALNRLVQLYNEKKNRPEYLFKTMLTPRFSVNQTWDSSYYHNHIVAADVVSMDSNLPLKKRDKIRVATGELQKVGMKTQLKEGQINDLQNLEARGGKMQEIVKAVMNDPVRCAYGIDERMEFLFLQGLSNGMFAVADGENTGIGVRVDFGYLADHKFSVNKAWSDAVNSTPMTDIADAISKAANEGNIITNIMMSDTAFNNLRKSREAKEFVANYMGIPVGSSSKIPTPTRNNMNEALKSEYGVEVIVVNRSVQIEKDGNTNAVRPWNEDKVIFLTDTNVGEFVYGQLVEETNPAEGVLYSKVNDYTLIKRWHNEEPFCEYTAAQALALPIIQNAHQIYQLDIKEEA